MPSLRSLSWHPFTYNDPLPTHDTRKSRSGHAQSELVIAWNLLYIVVSEPAGPYFVAAFLAIFEPPSYCIDLRIVFPEEHWPETTCSFYWWFIHLHNMGEQTAKHLRNTWGTPILGWHATLLGSISGFLDGHWISRPPTRWRKNKQFAINMSLRIWENRNWACVNSKNDYQTKLKSTWTSKETCYVFRRHFGINSMRPHKTTIWNYGWGSQRSCFCKSFQ